MKFKYRFIWILIILGIVALSACTVYAASSDSQDVKVTVDGVDFVLYDYCKVIKEEDNCAYFIADSKIRGYIKSIESEEELNYYIKNDFSNGYVVDKIENASLDADVYAYTDNLYEYEGYFLIFQKGKKRFVIDIYTNSTNSSDDTLSDMAFLIKKFNRDNDIAPIASIK